MITDPPGARTAPGDCLFCGIADGRIDAHIVHRDADTVAFLDHRPVFAGHVLLVPRTHVPVLADLPADLISPVFTAAQRLSAAMVAGLGAQGSFVAINNTVSQSVPHLHVHIVPRTTGDGLRGFFWPRTRYVDHAEASAVADRIRRALS
ncbi:HIT family protein [Rhodococcus sp. NPDC058505]|uniref:HIT family protein n=1 Tax=unclassified Rhodococcus (in: high G+C Gram-positive bacteria) TaxID=192944 RepID=UPI00366217FB